MHCHTCKKLCIKKGFQKNGTQKYYCKNCNRFQQLIYQRNAYNPVTDSFITKLLKSGCGTSGIKQVLEISATTVTQRIRIIARKIEPPMISFDKEYEADELCTYIGKKENKYWVAYAIEKESRNPVCFNVGKRTNRTLRSVINTLLISDAKKIHTDKLKNYRYLIPENIHRTRKYFINHIERKNLNLRMHLKRLGRKTICYSKSLLMLTACLKIYFWG